MPGADTDTAWPLIGLPAWSTTRYCTDAVAEGATTAGTSVPVTRVPVTCTVAVLTTLPEVTVTVITRLARLPPMPSVAVILPLLSVVVALCVTTPSLSADTCTGAPATTTREASTAVTV